MSGGSGRGRTEPAFSSKPFPMHGGTSFGGMRWLEHGGFETVRERSARQFERPSCVAIERQTSRDIRNGHNSRRGLRGVEDGRAAVRTEVEEGAFFSLV